MTVQDMEKAVRDAWIASLAAIGISVTLTLIYASGAGFSHVDWWNWLDIIILSILAYGIWRKNRWCAVLMLIYYVGSKIVLWVDERAFIGLPVAAIFAYIFWRGAHGAFALANNDT